MDKNPRKSKALIITFVLVLGLLIGMYFVFTSDTLFGVNNSVGKKFSPFLITPKEKGLNLVEDPNAINTDNSTNTDTDNPDNNTNPDGGLIAGGNDFSGNVGSGGVGTGIYMNPAGGSVALPGSRGTITPSNFVAQCKDGRDNDGDSLVDTSDPGCHTDGDATNAKSYNKDQYLEYNFIPACSDGVDNDKDKLIDDKDPSCHSDNNAKNTKTYTPNYGYESDNQLTKGSSSGECTVDDLPLIFTAEEQAQLDELTRQFYRLAPTLKSIDDILVEEKARQSYIDITDNANTLTNECYEQTYNDKYLANSGVVVTEGHEQLNTRFDHKEQKTPYAGDTKVSIDTMVPYLWDNNKTLLTGMPGLNNATQIPIYDYASKSWINKGRTERRGNPYIDLKPTSSYWQIYETKTNAKNGDNGVYVNHRGDVWNNTPIGNAYFPWADWENMMGIW